MNSHLNISNSSNAVMTNTAMKTQPFIAPRFFSAKRLVNTKSMSQAEWLEIRRKGIGSSDCAAACGLNPYMSM